MHYRAAVVIAAAFVSVTVADAAVESSAVDGAARAEEIPTEISDCR